MAVKNDELEELVKEQTALQCFVIKERCGASILDRTLRSRGLSEYGELLFGLNEGAKKFYGLLEGILKEKGRVVWADLGCGHAVALSEGKRHFEHEGIDMEKLRTYGYDAVLPGKSGLYRRLINEIIDERYAPKIIQADIATAAFEETPDLITAVCSLFWTRDPLHVFANAARQAKEGSVLCFNNLNEIRTKGHMGSMAERLGLSSMLFDRIIKAYNRLPGFEIISLSNDAIVARKTSNLEDYTYGFRLVSRHQDFENTPFSYVYTSDSGSKGRKREF